MADLAEMIRQQLGYEAHRPEREVAPQIRAGMVALREAIEGGDMERVDRVEQALDRALSGELPQTNFNAGVRGRIVRRARSPAEAMRDMLVAHARWR